MPPTSIRRRKRDTEVPATSRYRAEPAEEEDDDDTEEPAPRSRTRARGERPTRARSKPVEPDDEDDDDDDDEDDAPRSRRASSRRPAARRGRAADDDDDDDEDDDEEEEAPRSRRRTAKAEPARGSRRRSAPADDDDDDDEEDDEPPARAGRVSRASSRSRDKEPAKGSTRRRRSSKDDDDDEDEAPRSRRKAEGGWGSFKKQRAASFSSDDFKIEEGEPPVLIKILDDEPFATFRQHWVEGLRSTNKKSFTCIEVDCPLDGLEESNAHALFNIILMGDQPKLLVWDVGSGIAQTLEKKAVAKTGPLSKEYYAVSKDRTGGNKKGPVRWEVEVVRERDLIEDWDMEPLTDDELDDFDKEAKDGSYVKYPKKSELREIAKEISRMED